MSATRDQVSACFRVLRKMIDDTGWGGWVKDDKLMPAAAAAANAVVAAAPHPAPPPAPSSPPASPPVLSPSPSHVTDQPPAQSGTTQESKS